MAGLLYSVFVRLYVAERGDVDVAEALIAAGANPGVVDRLGWNALHFAGLLIVTVTA